MLFIKMMELLKHALQIQKQLFDEEIDKLEKAFGKLQRITNKNQIQQLSQKIGI